MNRSIAPAVLAVLQNVEVKGNHVCITEQLDRKLYEGVRDVLVALGGPWNRKAKAHVFEDDPTAALDAVISTGTFVSPRDVAKAFGFVATPPRIADLLIDAVDIEPRHSILEPSAGTGRLLDAIQRRLDEDRPAHIVAVEVQHDMAAKLMGHSLDPEVVDGDFLAFRPSQLLQLSDRIVMNPPFLAGADAKHVLHAWDFLTPGGRLAAICSAGVTFRARNADEQLRDLVKLHGSVEELDDDAFESEGVSVRTVMIILEKPWA